MWNIMNKREKALFCVLAFFVILALFNAAWAQDPTPDPAATAQQRATRAANESALARLLFDPHVTGLLEWGGGGGGALREITNDLPPGTDGFRFTERPLKTPGVFWFVLRLEPLGDPTAGWTRVFVLDEKEREHTSWNCYEPMINYLERKVAAVADAWFDDAVRRLAAERAENERRRPTAEPSIDDVADALLNGKTRLYRIPHEDFDLKTLRKTILVW